MFAYFRNYRYRIKMIILTIFSIFAVLFLHHFSFHNIIHAVSNQLENLGQSDYEYAYILNYDVELENKFVYPDAAISIYQDVNLQERLSVSVLMMDDDSNYTLGGFDNYLDLKDNEVLIPKSLAMKYGICEGDTIWESVSYSSDSKELVVKKIIDDIYDYQNPDIDRGILVCYLGYDSIYESNVLNKYIVFSGTSLAEKLSALPRVIDQIINKTSLIDTILKQTYACIIFEIVMVIAVLFLDWKLFFIHTPMILRKYYLKGASKIVFRIIPVIERLFLAFMPAFFAMLSVCSTLGDSGLFKKIYFGIPIILCGAFALMPAIILEKGRRIA